MFIHYCPKLFCYLVRLFLKRTTLKKTPDQFIPCHFINFASETSLKSECMTLNNHLGIIMECPGRTFLCSSPDLYLQTDVKIQSRWSFKRNFQICSKCIRKISHFDLFDFYNNTLQEIIFPKNVEIAPQLCPWKPFVNLLSSGWPCDLQSQVEKNRPQLLIMLLYFHLYFMSHFNHDYANQITLLFE